MTTNKNSNLEKLKKLCGPITFGDLLKDERWCKKMTQSELAKKLGINQRLLSEIERGQILPSLEFAEQIAKKIGCHPLQAKRVLQEQINKQNLKNAMQAIIPLGSKYKKI